MLEPTYEDGERGNCDLSGGLELSGRGDLSVARSNVHPRCLISSVSVAVPQLEMLCMQYLKTAPRDLEVEISLRPSTTIPDGCATWYTYSTTSVDTAACPPLHITICDSTEVTCLLLGVRVRVG